MTQASRVGRRGPANPVMLTIAGETRTLAAWSQIAGVHYETIRQRLRRGLLASEAVFGEKYSSHRIDCGQTAPTKRRAQRRTFFPVGPLPCWGGVQSINWRAA